MPQSTEWFGTPFHLTLCAQFRKKQTPLEHRENWGREEITAKEDLMHSDSCVTLVAWQQHWLGWPIGTKKAMWYEFQKWTEEGELCNRYTTLEELTSEMKGKKTHPVILFPKPHHLPFPLLPDLVDLPSFIFLLFQSLCFIYFFLDAVNTIFGVINRNFSKATDNKENSRIV